MANVLIAYFSRAGENYFAGEIKEFEKGNNEKIVDLLQERIESDIFRIEMLEPYSEEYITCTEQAQADLNNDARPALKNNISSIDQYEKIILVFPNYWGSVPMVVRTFCEQFDWSGKEVYPICSNEGSGFGNSIAHLRRSCNGATFTPGLSIVGNQVDYCQADVEEWLEDKGLV